MLNERAAADVHSRRLCPRPRPSVTAAVRFVTLRFTGRAPHTYIRHSAPDARTPRATSNQKFPPARRAAAEAARPRAPAPEEGTRRAKSEEGPPPAKMFETKSSEGGEPQPTATREARARRPAGPRGVA